MAIILVQQVFRIRTDATAAQGGTPVWAAAQNISAGVSIAPGTMFRIRFAIADTGTTAAAAQAYNLFVSKNAGAYAQVPSSAGSNPVYCTDATAGVSADNSPITSSLLTGASGTFSGVGVYDNTGTTASLTIAATSYVEFEFGIEFQAGVVANGDTYAFRVYAARVALTTYTVTPTLTIWTAATVSKLNAYAVLVGGAAQVSKLNAYAVLTPPPPPPATTIVLAATEQRDIASFTFLAPTSIVLAANEQRDIAAFSIINGVRAVLAATERRDIASFQFAPFGFPALQSPGLGWSVHRRPTFDTIIAPHPSGAEVRSALWANALWEFELTFDGLAGDLTSYPGLGINSYQALLGMVLTLGGTQNRFLYVDPDFNTLVHQLLGTGDGATTAFPLVRAIGGAVEPISWATGVSSVTVAGASAPFFMASPSVVQLATPPAPGALVAASFTYGFVCRLLEDTEDFEEFMFNLWTLKSFKFRQVRL